MMLSSGGKKKNCDCIHYQFHQVKSSVKACASIGYFVRENAVSKSTCDCCQSWRIKDGIFYVNDQVYNGAPSKVNNEELKNYLNSDSSRTQKEFAE